jgi:carbonic anhydrase
MLNPRAVAALREIKAGNRRFANDQSVHPDEGRQRRATIAAEQEPVAVIVGCADSRVSPELLFDQGLGDLFVVRTAGHVLDNVDVGTVQYATDFLHVPLVVVLGHRGCGAVGAAVAGEKVLGHLADVLSVLRESALSVQAEPGDWAINAVKANVRRTVSQLQSAALTANQGPDAPRPGIVGAYYHLVSGEVDWLDDLVEA